jgi:hypothetical protein
VPNIVVDWSQLHDLGFAMKAGTINDSAVALWINSGDIIQDRRQSLSDTTNSCTTLLRKLGLTPMASLYADFVEATPPLQQ